ncbi:family 2B encapsulin nanocompartment shell protein [Actinomadura alba]
MPSPGMSSLGTAAARNLATTTKSVPQMQAVSPRWLLKLLPWVQVSGGAYRVNRRLTYTIGDGRVEFTTTGSEVRVIPQELRELPALREFEDDAVLEALAGAFVQRQYEPGDLIAVSGQQADQVLLIAHGRVAKTGSGRYGDQTMLDVLADGDHLGGHLFAGPRGYWEFTATARTRCTVLALPVRSLKRLIARSPSLQAHIERYGSGGPHKPHNKQGEAAIELSAGHVGEPALPGTFVDYEVSPREYELSVAQTVLQVHTRVADLYSEPMDQTEQQLRLTIEALRERQEHELVNNPDFGLLHNADLKQRIHARTGPPTPDDLDELLCRRRGSKLLLAHPRTIAAFGRECNRRGVHPQSMDVDGSAVTTWRGVPLFPCDKIPVTRTQTSSVLVMRTGEEEEGVVGLHQTGIPDEYEPSLSVRFMGINEKAVINYLVSVYYSAAVLVPDALGVLENVEVSH